MLAKPDADSPEQCLQLPPSLELGGLSVDKPTGKRFAQPCIAYYLRASVSVNVGRDSGSKLLETSLPVVVAPCTKAFPPTETKELPRRIQRRRIASSTTDPHR